MVVRGWRGRSFGESRASPAVFTGYPVSPLLQGDVCIRCWHPKLSAGDQPTAITMKPIKIMKRFRFYFMGFMMI